MVFLAPFCRWGNWGLEELSDLAKVSELVNDTAWIQTKDWLPLQGPHAWHFTLLPVDLKRSPEVTVPGLFVLKFTPQLTLLCSASQWGWPQATCNSTNICVNWLLIEFANGRHEGDRRWRREKPGYFSPLILPVVVKYTCITSVVQLPTDWQGHLAPASSRWTYQLLPLSFP